MKIYYGGVSAMGKLPERKPNRLKGYDYSQNGAYFITICAKNRAEIFGQIPAAGSTIGASVARPPLPLPAYPSRPLPMPPLPAHTHTKLSPIGKIIENEIAVMQSVRASVIVDYHVIMPNHVHMIIRLNCGEDGGRGGGMDDGRGGGMDDGRGGRATLAPTTAAATVSEIIRQWKGAVAKRVAFSPWQKSFHDHIIRNEDDYNRIAEYIVNNPINWESDCFYGQD